MKKYLYYLKQANNVVIPKKISLNIRHYYYDINLELFNYYYKNDDYNNEIIYIINIIDRYILFGDDNIYQFMEVCLKLKKYDIYCKILRMLYELIIKEYIKN